VKQVKKIEAPGKTRCFVNSPSMGRPCCFTQPMKYFGEANISRYPQAFLVEHANFNPLYLAWHLQQADA